jgi:multiple sugar transport system ATP-binding protein
MSFLQLERVEKHFGEVRTIKGVDLAIERGQFTVFVGPSGCGKSTLLRLIAGLETLDVGRIVLDGRDITRLPSAQRDLAMVFQSYALYPHMTVAENMSFALRLAKADAAVIEKKVARAAEILNLGPYLKRLPRELSGGQRQRVAVARALVNSPSIVLADEPTGNLDSRTGEEIMALFANLHNQGNTIILVTHENDIAQHAHRIIHIRDGKIASDEAVKK